MSLRYSAIVCEKKIFARAYNLWSLRALRLSCNATGLPYDAVMLPSISAYYPCVRFYWKVIDLFG
jgi:hypothetical protein